MKIASYGSWVSPISAEDLVGNSNGIAHSYGQIDQGYAYWGQAIAQEAGRVSIFRRRLLGGGVEQVTPKRYVRSGINEYGGGAWTVSGGSVIYSDWPSGDLHIVKDGVDSLWLSGENSSLRYGCLSFYPEQNLLLGVCEDHRGTGEARNTIFAAHTESGQLVTLVQGADFYAYPVLSSQGMLAWMEWNHPNMPWDETRIMAAPFGAPQASYQVSSQTAQAAVYPAWTPSGSLIYLSDLSGYWNFYRCELTSKAPAVTALHNEPYDFADPMWTPDPAPYSILDDDRIGCSWLDAGISKLGVLKCDNNQGENASLVAIETAANSIRIFGHGVQTTAMFGYADRASELVVLDWHRDAPALTVIESDSVQSAQSSQFTNEHISIAQPLVWDGANQETYAWYYPPINPDFQAPAGELPPVQVWSHGGPTSYSSPKFRLDIQYWTSRGIGILDVNYSGSTGFGKQYRERLHGNWGIADVQDCVDAAKALVNAGLADPAKISIRGGSAGGYTTLRALTTSTLFSAGISIYGVGDLEAMTTDTHKFESRYLDGLIAPYPAQRQVYLERSPIYHLDKLNCPLLLLQGADDLVVPPQQAYAIAEAAQTLGLPVTMKVFEGEGHGFRKAESIIETARLCLDFLSKTYGFVLPTD